MIRHARPAPAAHFTPAILTALFLPAVLAGCASRPAPVRPAPRLTLRAESVQVLDQRRSLIRLEARLENPSDEPLAIRDAACSLEVEGAESTLPASLVEAFAPGGAAVPVSAIDAGGESRLLFERLVRIDALDESVRGPAGPATAAWAASARLSLAYPDGSAVEARAGTAGALPIVREPEFRITSLKIERDVLVTTNLMLGLEVRNPNAFPLELRSIAYDFRGEGRAWASGSDGGATAIPAGGRIERGLRFTMNFADVDRRLFDLVARLRTIRYGLSGTATVVADVEGVPPFALDFDLEGSCPVEK